MTAQESGPHNTSGRSLARVLGTERLVRISFDIETPSSPLLTTLRGLALIARMRGDQHDIGVLADAAALVTAQGIRTDKDLGPLVEQARNADPVLTRLRHLFEAGGWVMLESAIADLPADLRWLFEAEAVNIDQLATLHARTEATAVSDFADLVRREQLRQLPGFDREVELAVASALPQLRQARRRIPLGRAMTIAHTVLDPLRAHPRVLWAEVAGSIRRGQETVGDIEIVVASEEPEDVLADLLAAVDISRFLHRSARRLYIISDGTQVGIRCAEPQSSGAVLLHMTGSFGHLDALHARAAQLGLELSPGGVGRDSGSPSIGETEEAVYQALGLPWIPAEIRDGATELQAAETGGVPRLLDRQDIRGDLHMHTVYSDGRDTIDAMARACVALRYEYMAVTDHSPRSSAAASLTLDGVARQAEDIAALRERYPGLTILHGCEVDILPDGRLDFPDRILERFDIVLASMHDRAGHDGGALLERYLSVMRHPLVSIISHPTNRLVPGRSGYDLDYDHLFAVAVETGTMLEIDGGPSHLDLDGPLARRAVAAGAMIVVDSDGHRADALGRQMELGVKTARRGWVEARHVMNTRSIGDLRALITGKRFRSFP